MGVRLSEDEAWVELDTAHTGILTTVRRDGRPVSLPVWFATVGRHIYVRTPAKTRKVEHVRNDPRVECVLLTVRDGMTVWRKA